jgi:glycosyltransferase involved in cell wall biosynthesis
MSDRTLSIVIPAKNEAPTIGRIVTALRSRFADAEIIVVDDGSDDDTGSAAGAAGARVVRHPRSRGNGAAVKSGARAARGARIVLMDADGQHDPADIPRLLEALDQGHDLVIGARDAASQASFWRLLGNGVYNRLASLMVGHRIPDLTSGFRAADAAKFREFLYLYPNGFSYPTTCTMAFFRAGYGVAFVPITTARREADSHSHINIVRDGGRFLLIIFRIGTLYSPLKIFFPFSLLFFIPGIVYSTYTLAVLQRFTNFGALLLISSILVFLIGLVSEQITNLLYAPTQRD